MAKVAFIGLGVMGYPMAGHLKAAGHEVVVYNRTTAKAEAWVAQHGGSHALTPRAAAEGCDFVMTCVGNDDDLRSVVFGEEGALAFLGVAGADEDEARGVADRQAFAFDHVFAGDRHVEQQVDDVILQQVDLVDIEIAAIGAGDRKSVV